MDRELREIEGGLNLQRPSIAQIAALMRVLHAYTRQAIEDHSVDVLMGFLYGHLNTTLQQLDHSPIACRMGCSFCCTSWVAATAPEVLYVLKSVPADRIGKTRDFIAAAAQTTAAKTPEERLTMITPCPLLESSACSVYGNRPLVCRTAVSNDVSVCERVYVQASKEEIPGTYHHYGVKGIYSLALAGALKKAGLLSYYYEFNDALHAAARARDAEADWLSGKDIFSDIKRDPEGETFGDAWNRNVFEQAFP